jgi:hypothetical protein
VYEKGSCIVKWAIYYLRNIMRPALVRAGWQQGRMCLLLLIVGNGKTTPVALFFQRIF